VELDAAVSVARDAVEHFDDVADLNSETRFLAHFPDDGGVQFFARFYNSPRQAPAALQRLLTALDEHNPLTVEDDGADADDGPIRIPSHALPWLGSNHAV